MGIPIVSDRLRKKIERKGSGHGIIDSNNYTKVMVFLKEDDKYSIKKLRNLESKEQTINELKTISEQIQKPIKCFLDNHGYIESQFYTRENVNSNHVFVSCWLSNVIQLYGNRELVLELENLADSMNISHIDSGEIYKAKYSLAYQFLEKYGRGKHGIAKWLKSIHPTFRSKTEPKSWHFASIDANEVPESNIKSSPVICAVIDQGLNYEHEDLSPHMWNDPKDSSIGYSFDPIRGPDTKHGLKPDHGTACASLIVGGFTGIATNTKIMNLVVDNQEISFCKALAYATENGAQVVSCSLNFVWEPKLSEDQKLFRIAIYRRAIDKIYACGLICVVSAGNLGKAARKARNKYRIPNNVVVPANCPSPLSANEGGRESAVITVGATLKNNRVRESSSKGPVLWNYSEYGYGDYSGGLVKPDICAPGTRLTACLNSKNGYYHYFGWTSGAAALVAGTICLLINSENSESAKLDQKKIQMALENGATNRPTNKKNNEIGAGILNLKGAFANF